MASCPRLTDLESDINEIKRQILNLNPNCRGGGIHNYIADRMDDIIYGLSHVSSNESLLEIIDNMNKVSYLLQDNEIAELLRSVTYGKYHSDKVVSDFKAKLQEFEASDDTAGINLEVLTDSDEHGRERP